MSIGVLVAGEQPFTLPGEFDLITERFRNSDLVGASFQYAHLRSVALHGSKLDRANFTGADLTAVNFFESSMHGATFATASLDRSDLTKVEGLGFWKRVRRLAGIGVDLLA